MKEYIECSCGTELLQLEFGEEDDPLGNELYISYYTYGQKGNRYPLMMQLRHIWRIIRHGTPFSDYIILNGDNIGRLKKFLDKIEETKKI